MENGVNFDSPAYSNIVSAEMKQNIDTLKSDMVNGSSNHLDTNSVKNTVNDDCKKQMRKTNGENHIKEDSDELLFAKADTTLTNEDRIVNGSESEHIGLSSDNLSLVSSDEGERLSRGHLHRKISSSSDESDEDNDFDDGI